ncbi:hypothetical protein BDW74DRAFT_170978 [Aspergillus multicolor]|uniref:uncharacterized protein n=1 Tax=Aspergillus multicolor TaxID=41759 RepID=UPI003CCD83D3
MATSTAPEHDHGNDHGSDLGKAPAPNIEELIRQVVKGQMPAQVGMDLLKSKYMRSYATSLSQDQELAALAHEREQYMAQVEELNADNQQLYNEMQENQRAAEAMRDAMEMQEALSASAHANASSSGPKAAEQVEAYRKIMQRERELVERFKDHETQSALLEQRLAAADSVIEQYKVRLAAHDHASGQWAENLQKYTGWLSNENLQLRRHLNEQNAQLLAQRQAQAARWTGTGTGEGTAMTGLTGRFQSLLARPQGAVSVLTTGTLDVGMDDAFDVDMPMPTAAEKHKTPSGIRARRHMGKTKTAAKRPGATGPRAARPVDSSKGVSAHRAASTYLQYRDGRKEKKVAMGALKPRGRTAGMSLSRAPGRKRTRLGQMLDRTKRIEAVTDTRVLPPIPRSLRVRASAEAYTKRNDRELSLLMMSKWHVDEKKKDVSVSTEDEGNFGKLITITKAAAPFIPRPKTYAGPKYLPRTPEALTKDERSHWSKVTQNWTIGPAQKAKSKGKNKSKGKTREGKKQVRFADVDDIEIEPTLRLQQTMGYESRHQDDSSFQWSHLIIAILLVLLMISHLAPDVRVWSWQNANVQPEDIVARMRVPGPGDARVPVMDFAVGKVSDVDAGISG